MILEAGILERFWEQLSIYISIPYPLYSIATIFYGSLQMLLNLGLKLPFILLHFLLSITWLRKKYQLFGKPQ